jgi:hypothetical protein
MPIKTGKLSIAIVVTQISEVAEYEINENIYLRARHFDLLPIQCS